MLQQGRCSSPLELSTSGLDSPPLFGLYSVGCTATGAEKQRRNQQTEFYLNYGRAVRVLREDVARSAAVDCLLAMTSKAPCRAPSCALPVPVLRPEGMWLYGSPACAIVTSAAG